jgi:UDP-2,4-diacetamido-2,4,6-trideoxy-beta-L-altropyranose hydrolase
MRCLALAQAWCQAGGNVVFAMPPGLPDLEARVKAEQSEVVLFEETPCSREDADKTIDLARQRGAAWVVVDGYPFTGGYQHRLKEAGLRLLVLDDYGHADHYWADIVLNQNLGAQEDLYLNRTPETRLLLGPQFALLRTEFLLWKGWRRDIPLAARKVLVTLGGTDPDRVTHRVVDALIRIPWPDFQAIILVSGGTFQDPELQTKVGQARGDVKLKALTTDVPGLMAWADLAIGAGGATAWERAFMALPSIVLVLADNQVSTATALADHGIALNLGWGKAIDPATIFEALTRLSSSSPLRRELARRSRSLVDGSGAAVTVENMLGLSNHENQNQRSRPPFFESLNEVPHEASESRSNC